MGSIVEVFTDLSVWMGIRNTIERVNANAAASSEYMRVSCDLRRKYRAIKRTNDLRQDFHIPAEVLLFLMNLYALSGT